MTIPLSTKTFKEKVVVYYKDTF